MSSHATLDQLSGYLDAELSPAGRLRVERHLDGCRECRERLGGLRRVAGRLERLRIEAPPRHLGEMVANEVRALPRKGLLARLEERAGRPLLQPMIAPLFGVILALGVIFYLFSTAVSRHGGGEGRPRLIWWPRTDEAPAGATGVPAESWVRVAGRWFAPRDGGWIEEGLEQAEPERRGAPAELVAVEPRLEALIEELAGLGGTVRFRYRERVLEVVYPASPTDTD